MSVVERGQWERQCPYTSRNASRIGAGHSHRTALAVLITWPAAPVVGTTKPKIIGCVDTNPRLREPTPVIVETAAMVLPDALTIPASTNVGYIHRREKRYDSTAAAAADTGIRPATPQRMRHNPRRPPGARRHHRDCDLPRRIRPAGLDLQLTMAAPTVGGARLLAADPPGGDVIPGQ